LIGGGFVQAPHDLAAPGAGFRIDHWRGVEESRS